jgi:hypothetical protein
MLPDPLQLLSKLYPRGTSSIAAAISRLDSHQAKTELADWRELSAVFRSAGGRVARHIGLGLGTFSTPRLAHFQSHGLSGFSDIEPWFTADLL